MLIRTAPVAGLLAGLVTAASFAALGAQASEPSRVEAAFGNTVMSVYPDGRSQKIWLHPDGRWDGLGRDSKPLAGHWTMKGDKVCLRQSKPPTLPFSYCTAFPVDPHVGVTWASHDFGGTPIKLTVVKGIAEARQLPAEAMR